MPRWFLSHCDFHFLNFSYQTSSVRFSYNLRDALRAPAGWRLNQIASLFLLDRNSELSRNLADGSWLGYPSLPICVLVSTPRHACVHWPSRLCRLQWPGMFGRPNLDSADPIASPGWIGRSTGDFRRFLETCLDWIQTLNEILLRYLVGPSRSFLGTAGISRGCSYLVCTRSGYKAPCSSQTPGIKSSLLATPLAFELWATGVSNRALSCCQLKCCPYRLFDRRLGQIERLQKQRREWMAKPTRSAVDIVS